MTLGLDISNNNGAVDVAALKRAHPHLTVLGVKCTEGAGFADQDFAANFKAGVAAGLVVNPYHFARPESHPGLTGGKNEADFFLYHIKDFTSAKLMGKPVLDYETVKDIAFAEGFALRVKAVLGVYPIIYCSGSRVAEIDSSVTLRHLDLWVAAYGSQYKSYVGTHQGRVVMWQYTDKLDGKYDASDVLVHPDSLLLHKPPVPVVVYDVIAGGKLRLHAKYGYGRVAKMLKSSAFLRVVQRFHGAVVKRVSR